MIIIIPYRIPTFKSKSKSMGTFLVKTLAPLNDLDKIKLKLSISSKFYHQYSMYLYIKLLFV